MLRFPERAIPTSVSVTKYTSADPRYGCVPQHFQLVLVLDPALKVPGHQAIGRLGRGAVRSEAAALGGLKDSFRQRTDLLVGRMREQLGRRTTPRQSGQYWVQALADDPSRFLVAKVRAGLARSGPDGSRFQASV